MSITWWEACLSLMNMCLLCLLCNLAVLRCTTKPMTTPLHIPTTNFPLTLQLLFLLLLLQFLQVTSQLLFPPVISCHFTGNNYFVTSCNMRYIYRITSKKICRSERNPLLINETFFITENSRNLLNCLHEEFIHSKFVCVPLNIMLH